MGSEMCIRDSLSVPVGGGALIQSFIGNSTAQKAGLLATRRGISGIAPGDVVVAVDGKPCSVADGAALDFAKDVGDDVQLTVLRRNSVGDASPSRVTATVRLTTAND